MGWYWQRRDKGQSNEEFFDQLLPDGHRIEACATVRGTFYAAVRDGDTVTGFVAPTRWAHHDWQNFGYKAMGEASGPAQDHAPAKVLDALTDTTHPHALDWRRRCRDNLESRARQPRVRPGDIIEFRDPLTFTNGDTLDTLQLEGRATFRDPTTGRRYHVTRWRERPYQVLGR